MRSDLDQLRSKIVEFAAQRNWQQFHTLKDLAISVALEAGELLELVQWRNEDETAGSLNDEAIRAKFSGECADVLFYLLLLCNRLDIDLVAACELKLSELSRRYPSEKYMCVAPHKYGGT